MLLTRKAQASAAPQARLARGLNGVLAATLDRRAFLKGSGMVTILFMVIGWAVMFLAIGLGWGAFLLSRLMKTNPATIRTVEMALRLALTAGRSWTVIGVLGFP